MRHGERTPGPLPGGGSSRVVFLAGMGRSGSTLLERLLGQTAAIAPLGEVMHLWRRGVLDDERCGCGRAFRTCPFWLEVGDLAFGGWSRAHAERVNGLRRHVDRALRVPQLSSRRPPDSLVEATTEYAASYAAVYAAAHQVSGCRVLIDSSKQVSLPFCLSWRPEIDLRVVHCVRDPRAVVHAWTKSVPRPEASDADARMPTYHPLSMCAQWSLHNAEVALLRRRRVTVSRVRYEDLVVDPVGELHRLLSFVGAPDPLEFLVGHQATLAPAHTCAGNPMRFVVGPVAITNDDTWRRDLSPTTRRAVSALTLPLLHAYGYSLRAGS